MVPSIARTDPGGQPAAGRSGLKLAAAPLLPEGPVRPGRAEGPRYVRRHQGGRGEAARPAAGRFRGGQQGRPGSSPSSPSSTLRRATAAKWPTPRTGVSFDSPQCVGALRFYRDLLKNHSLPGLQDTGTVRTAYFAGKAAMAVWPTFMLDELAGLRSDARPNCPECSADPGIPGQEYRRCDRHPRCGRRSPRTSARSRPGPSPRIRTPSMRASSWSTS